MRISAVSNRSARESNEKWISFRVVAGKLKEATADGQRIAVLQFMDLGRRADVFRDWARRARIITITGFMTPITAITTFGTTMKMSITISGRARIMSTNTETSASYLLSNRKNIGPGVTAMVIMTTTTITSTKLTFTVKEQASVARSPARQETARESSNEVRLENSAR